MSIYEKKVLNDYKVVRKVVDKALDSRIKYGKVQKLLIME